MTTSIHAAMPMPLDGISSSPFLTPTRRRPVKTSAASPLAASVSLSMPTTTTSSSADSIKTNGKTNATEASPSSSTDAAVSRKRKSVGSSTVKALANCYLSTTQKKKRARLSLLGANALFSPGKANVMAEARERDVAKRFLDLEVSEVYRAIRKQTGALGGNAAGGAIYGEITQHSFQRIVDFLKENCEFSSSSLFLDVGSGLGKPNFHVAVDPGVEVSFGVELEELRWQLSLHNLKSVITLDSNRNKSNRVVFSAGDITHAHTLNPFSHIYSFDVGFPPDVMDYMATMFNRSKCRYYASFHSPRKVIETYGFRVEHIGRVATSMAGSNEGHTCYFYRRLETAKDIKEKAKRAHAHASSTSTTNEQKLHIDPLFRPGFEILSRGNEGVLSWITSFFGEQASCRTRRQKRALQAHLSVERPLESYYRVVGKPRIAAELGKKLASS